MSAHETERTTDTTRRDGPPARARLRRAGTFVSFVGLVLHAVAAPHSIAGAWMGLSLVTLGWLLGLLGGAGGRARATRLDLPLWLLFNWTIITAILSYEPRISLAKLALVSNFLVFYVLQAALTRRAAVVLAALMILSAAAGVLWGAGELAAGRGVLVDEIRADSTLAAETPLRAGDAVWRVGGRRVSSVAEIDERIRGAQAGERLSLSVITRGEHAEWPGFVVGEETKRAASPSGITSRGPTRRFRASGWTRHYETFSELLQILAQLALGFALAAHARGRPRRLVLLAAAAFALLGLGIALTAMRTVLVAYTFGAFVILVRASVGPRTRLALLGWLAAAVAAGALAVWATRAGGALVLRDDSSALRAEVARVAVGRVAQHPLFGHGMDAVKRHWQEWGFPGDQPVHTHSTPVQLAFDRGLPALLLWLWAMASLWLMAARAERMWRESDDAGAHGLTLGATGALAGFLASSIVNYNFGDSEVALLLWWLAAAVVVFSRDRPARED
ncbi:MAG TPA: O-antigen ligase family protein [Pyrinomonadaceae bacterium]|nr:O-antigen ligase family protein [Pyrinomonadaceae bacterium]